MRLQKALAPESLEPAEHDVVSCRLSEYGEAAVLVDLTVA